MVLCGKTKEPSGIPSGAPVVVSVICFLIDCSIDCAILTYEIIMIRGQFIQANTEESMSSKL